MDRAIIVFLLFAILAFSEKYPKKEIINIIEKNEKYECSPDRQTKEIKWEEQGKSFVGHLDENGKRYGEWTEAENDALRECYLENGYINYYKNNYFTKENDKISLIVNYGDKKDNIQIILKNMKTEEKIYYFERRKKRYRRKNLIMTFDPAYIPPVPISKKVQ